MTTNTGKAVNKRARPWRSNPYARRGAKFVKMPDTLTGGTQDVNPQYMHATVTQSGADTVTTKEINMPIIRLPRANRTQIVEILKVYFYPPSLVAPNAGGDYPGCECQLLTSDSTTLRTFDDSTVLASYKMEIWDSLVNSTVMMEERPFIYDMTDGAGHGVLVGSDKLYLLLQTTAQGVAKTMAIKILYRLKAVPLSEYIGIVQSQT